MDKISAVIITYNEERNIARCIESALKVADEIIVVDSYSKDATADICYRYPQVKFFEKAWEGYSKNKNYANSLATYSYILSIDADEEITDELAFSILKEKENLNGAYAFNRLTNYCGYWIKHCGWYPDTKIRLFPKGKAFWEGDFVHEELKLDKDLPVKFLYGNLNHYSYYTQEEHLKRIEKYSDLHAQKMQAEGKKSNFIKQYLAPVFKFFKTYFLQLGVMDGYPGFIISFYSAKAVYLKYKKLSALKK
jgi:(heptosyl)LPS beta-1,4-glucosyltransferase